MKADKDQQMLVQIQKRMDKLRRLDDEQPARNYSHFYCMNPPLPASRSAALEQHYQISLPAEYRLFLQEIGNGSTDPQWGLFSLEDALQFRWSEEEKNQSGYFREPFVPPISLADADSDGWGGPGLLMLEHTGCGECSYLVVSGTEYGHIWQGQPDWLFPASLPSELPEHLRKNTVQQCRDYLLSRANTARLTFLLWWYQRLCGGW